MGNEQSSINNIVKIGVVGLKKSGKSTLLNKLIGQDILSTNNETNNNILIKNSILENPELISNNMILAQGKDNICSTLSNNNIDNILVLKMKLKSLDSNIQFYDTLGLERQKSHKGRIVMDIVRNCEVILYVLNFQDIIYEAVFTQYELLKKYKKTIYIIVTHIDLFVNNELFNSDMKIKNTVVQKFSDKGISLNIDSIILLNLLAENNDNFMLLVSIINNLKMELENIKLKKQLESVEYYQNDQIISGVVNIITSIAKNI